MIEFARIATALLLTSALASTALAADCSRVPAELDLMVEIDQAVREESSHLDGLDAAAQQRLFNRWEVIDLYNTRQLKAIIARCGWPDAKRFDTRTADKAWLLAQHADRDRPFQRRVLAMLRAGVASGSVPPQNLAYMTDRVAIAEQRPQPYGTQFTMPDRCTLQLLPLDGSREQVEARRKAVSLESLEAYEQHARSMLPADCRP